MGPKKDLKKVAQKRDQNPTIEESINTDSWRCIVVMAVEKTPYDSFVLKEFMEEFSSGRRQEVELIDFDTLVLKILKDFATGELHYKYLPLMNFSSILQEASEYVSKEIDIPAPVLAKVVKVILFYLRDDSLLKIEKKAAGPQDPILAMAERPINFGLVDTKKKETTKKADNVPKARPPSVTKQDTRLLKRGERVKDEQRIDDAPLNGYFNLYVLLTGFYQPDFPLELLKGGVPLHGLLCIDTSLSAVKRDGLGTDNRFQKYTTETKSQEIQNFWDVFLKILWDPKASPHFKDTVFQVYVPQRLCCEKNKLREFIYREISYLMYDFSDFKRQLNNYLRHLKLWDVEDKERERTTVPTGAKDIPEECATVPLVLQCIIDTICGDDSMNGLSLSSDSIDSMDKESKSSDKSFSLSAQGRYGSYGFPQDWSQAFITMPDFDLLSVYHKTKELDVRYDLDNKSLYFHHLERTYSKQDNSEKTCDFHFQSCGENMKEALAEDGALQSYWKKYGEQVGTPFALDYCLYPLLMTRVFCPFLANPQIPPIASSYHSLKKNSYFQLIENLSSQMRKPHFTVTDSSRKILKALPYNVKDTSKDFFSLPEFKVVSPEMLKASSSPQFRVGPCLKIHRAFTSQIFSHDTSKNPFDNLRQFLGECFFANINGFDFLELLGKEQLLDKKKTHWNNYNCVDHAYSIVNDCIFIILHNRMEDQNIHHETFNEMLKTGVGLRDFYDYILEDEAEWLASQEQSFHLLTIYKNDSNQTQVLNGFSESDFWLANSIKYQEGNKFGRRDVKDGATAKAKSLSAEKAVKNDWTAPGGLGDMAAESLFEFEGYNVSDMAVQFSGLKTVYYSNDCSMTVELCERLYGNQELGIHVRADGHTLHLYSYVCPEPHILDPFTFHLTYKNGVIVAFTRRFTETFEEVEEIIESKTATKGKKNSSELSTRVVKRQVLKTVRDEDFIYDMAASLPNGLCIRTVRREVEPCYIIQHYLVRTDNIARLENSRLFLPNGNVVRMLSDGTVEVLKPDTSTVTASLSDLGSKGEPPSTYFDPFHYVSPEGYACTFENGQMTSPIRLQILQNTDLDANRLFFRRRDGTSYMLQSDGSLCMEFKDGTKISSSVFVMDGPDPPQKEEVLGETDSDLDFFFVYTKTIMEHPDYATVIYDTYSHKWTILLPQDSAITVDPDGQYSVDIDKHTELRAEEWVIQMNRYSSGRQLECAATADLSVFENKDGSVYCHMEDLKGKIFIVEANSNCYILDDERVSEDSESQKEEPSLEDQSQSSVSEFVASADLQCSPSVHTEKGNKLSRSNKYFVLKRDMTGFEILHLDDVSAALSEKDKGSLIFSEKLPDTDNRLFVLITPERSKTCRKWQVATVLPNPRYKPSTNKKETSSTYGCPPSWMHPFPKRKSKFHVPQPLHCRLFIETKKTQLSPPVGEIDCSFCELDDATEVHDPGIPPERVEEYLTKLSNNDQNLLGKMYAHVAKSLINEKKKLRSVHSEKLEHYLNMSKYYVGLQEYHKQCLRYRAVPNYFHHPVGMSWLILNEVLNKLQIADESEMQVPRLGPEGSSEKSSASSKLTAAFSNEEIEYNMSRSGAISFSELSYRSDLSSQTAPPVLRTAGLCTCKVSSAKDAASAPAIKCYWDDTLSLDDQQSHPRICDFHQNDLEMLYKGDRQVPPMTLEDLMSLGLI